MTREEAKQFLPIIQAWADGKVIQIKDSTSNWEDVKQLSIYFNKPSDYRIKLEQSEPKYRPFKNSDECWAEMKKHQPFGWIRNDRGIYLSMGVVDDTEFDYQFDKFKFADGAPFGILLE